MSIVETFHGYVETTQDTLLIFEACRRGLLPRICRRLQEKERRIVQSGTVFVFDERESGIKRWTDGLIWSPSRILGNFLEGYPPSERASRSSPSDIESAVEKSKERALVGSLTNSYHFKKNGLIKKTMSIVVNGVPQHMISYYSREDVLGGRLRTPSSVPELQPYELLNKPGSSAQNQHSRPVSGSFEHTVGPNNDFSPVTFGHNNLNLRIETDITERFWAYNGISVSSPTSGANTFGGAPSDINNNHSQMPQQPQHTHQQQQHHQHYQNTQPPPSTQGWSDFNYPSYSTTTAPASLGPTMDHPSQQRGPRNDSS
ncbi:Gti1/Pac2 family-domain-containing protein [Lobosporangium transversale]|uniref:Gti1/Pac2 family-domain-containing protein n=1 Tax=Lobosporangium transversale TaxID=64571 RepID=A0A1Y2GJU9_9FUNG|nr:Gti1/Pac2 family-domain-containing protein [Lobosporangium transversale]XP_021879845.1 Gti1/Pac2 family-domain-containing protein [Lobosporangium transversale]ORZ10946.1 Gti1/Pac2 family-domain-containing protein [Lobosporangium transversale]ORZ11748.1 Gti1/Pac2 family-domain-containing protein [Lobosporangium transversale]|eukprot:XP_021879463.1 Gti1/Pac2 family-domain-containing protein [Lobosporangium transversale]